MRVLLSVLLVLLLVPGWTGEERLALPGPGFAMTARPVALHPGDPNVRRVGALRYLGGVELGSDDPAFGGFSALAVAGERFTMISDGGNLLSFRMGADWRPRDARHRPLRGGPGRGWEKRERDTEALAVDPATGRLWIAFERINQIWRYGPKGEVRHVAPRAMRGWRDNSGAESMARLPDGRFVLLSEARAALLFRGDPVEGARARPFRYQAAPGMRPVDAASLPDGRLLVLERRFRPFNRWSNRLALVDPRAIRTGATLTGRTLARLEPPLISDNFEGVAVAREGGATVLWLVSDDNGAAWQRTLLLKFRLE